MGKTKVHDKQVDPSIANASVVSSFVITPELPIGTEFWFLQNNRIELGLVAAYTVHVTSCVGGESWHRQLFGRWLNKKAKEVWKYSFTYEAKLDRVIYTKRLEKRGNKWFLYYSDKEIFFSIDELKRSL